MLTPKLGTDGQVIIDISMADLDIRIERKNKDIYVLSCVDTSGIPTDVLAQQVDIPTNRLHQVLTLICDGNDEEASLYDGLEEIFETFPLNLRPIP